jgi:hypothetical protein
MTSSGCWVPTQLFVTNPKRYQPDAMHGTEANKSVERMYIYLLPYSRLVALWWAAWLHGCLQLAAGRTAASAPFDGHDGCACALLRLQSVRWAAGFCTWHWHLSLLGLSWRWRFCALVLAICYVING